MKTRILAIILVLALCVGMFVMPVGAAETEPVVYVTISVKGELVLGRLPVQLSDTNKNDKYDIDDALRLAHEALDLEEGYESADTEYGLAITKLWGDDSGAFGYWNDGESAMNLEEEVKDGCEINAFVYQDQVSWGDAFTKFDVAHKTVNAGESVELTLSKAGWDASWNLVWKPADGAEITIDGQPTGYVTDKDGKVTIPMNQSGLFLISAVNAASSSEILVPTATTVRVVSDIETLDWRAAVVYALRRTAAYTYKQEDASWWAVVGLNAAGADIPESYLELYFDGLSDKLESGNGVLSANKYTEYSRAILAVTSAGLDATKYDGYDLTKPLENYDVTVKQGINGIAYALLALDSASYKNTQREKYVQALLDAQRSDGGWDLKGEEAAASDVDVTAICLQALAPYAEEKEAVALTVEKGVAYLSKVQQKDGGFASYGVSNPESCAMVILALCQLDIPLNDARFVKEGKTVLDAMLTYQNEDGGFCHEAGKQTTELPTYQAQLALAALLRQADGVGRIYDMTEEYGTEPFEDVLFTDWYWDGIHYAYTYGMVNGITETTYEPKTNTTRGMLVTLLYRLVGEPEVTGENPFTDVKEERYYTDPVIWAAENGIVNGMTETTFQPESSVTREQAATILHRFGQWLGYDASGRADLSGFPDVAVMHEYAKDAMAWAVDAGLINGNTINGVVKLDPLGSANRAQIATILMRYDQQMSEAEWQAYLETYFK